MNKSELDQPNTDNLLAAVRDRAVDLEDEVGPVEGLHVQGRGWWRLGEGDSETRRESRAVAACASS